MNYDHWLCISDVVIMQYLYIVVNYINHFFLHIYLKKEYYHRAVYSFARYTKPPYCVDIIRCTS